MPVNAAPMITPTARSITLPRAMNSRNSDAMLMRASSRLLVGVEALAQLLAALEERHVLGAHVDRGASAGIAAGARIAGAHGKRPEATKLHTSANFQGLDHPLEDHADDAFDVALREMRIFLGEAGDQFRLDHAN